METPWGRADWQTDIAPGIIDISTASHGGLWLSKDRWNAMMDLFPDFRPFAGVQWLEEDCDWIMAVLTWPVLFPVEQIRAAWQTAQYSKHVTLWYWTTERGQMVERITRQYEEHIAATSAQTV